MLGEIIHFRLHYTVIGAAVVPVVGSGVVKGRIDTQGGRRPGLLVHCTDGTARVIYESDVVTVRG